MKKLFTLLFAILNFTSFAQEEIEYQRCATQEYHKMQMARLANSNQKWANQRIENVTFSGIITIPVVVHVIHNRADGAIGGSKNSNITDEQIFSQIKVLNEDFRKKTGTNGFNFNSVGADVEMEFALAQIDPNCNPTSGITRHYSTTKQFDPHDNSVKSFSAWPADQYLNIWVCSTTNLILGLAQYPNYSNLAGLSEVGGDFATDGIIVRNTAFGSKTGTSNSGSYSYGRTTTHEIGHWLGLLHTWGDANCGTDYCRDTPYERDKNVSVCNTVISDCDSSFGQKVMIENYLDYSPDICMNIFTQDQKARMWQTMTTSPDRSNILTYIKNGVNEKTIAPSEVSFPFFQNFENSTQNIAEVSANCEGINAAFRKANSSVSGYFFHSDWVNNVQSSNYTLSFDYASVAQITDTLFIYGYTGCQTGKFIIASFTGNNLITSSNSVSNFIPQCDEWKSKSLSFTVPYPYFDLQFETNNTLNNNIYVDNISMKQYGFIPNLQSRILGNPAAKVLAGYDIENQKITLEVLFSSTSNVDFEVIDMLGKKVNIDTFTQVNPGIFEISVSNLATGMYIIKTKVNGQVVVAKVLVI